MSAGEFNFYTLRTKPNMCYPPKIQSFCICVTILRIAGEIAFISANFDVGVSCSSIFVLKGIVHMRLE